MPITVSIHMMDQSALGIAPEGVFLEARFADADVAQDLNRLNYDPSFHRSRVRWTFTKQGETYAAQASDKVVNLPAAFNDTNTAYGKRVGHVFTEPGTWIIDVEVQDFSGNVGTAQMTHTVGDPETAFPGNRTILVGTSDQATYPESQTVSSLAEAIAAQDALGQTARILMQRGTVRREQQLEIGDRLRNFHLGAYGQGPRPILAGDNPGNPGRIPPLLDLTLSGDLRITGVQLQGAWDSRSETGSLVDGLRWQATEDQRRYGVIRDCVFDGLEIAVELGRQDAALRRAPTTAPICIKTACATGATWACFTPLRHKAICLSPAMRLPRIPTP